ncbi:MAG: hypothetical protein WBL49_12880 [Nitrososphaeraceae archaeon]
MRPALRFKIIIVLVAFLTIQVVPVSIPVVKSKSFTVFQQPAHATIDSKLNYLSDYNNSSMEDIFGAIASIQGSEDGNLTWILSGYWRTNIPNQLLGSSGNLSSAGLPFFDSSFDMVLTNGSARHQHRITNFTMAGASLTNNNMTWVINGTSAVTMKDGPVENVPINITIMNNNVISIWLDPIKTNNHFGDTPIFGTVNATTVRNETDGTG